MTRGFMTRVYCSFKKERAQKKSKKQKLWRKNKIKSLSFYLKNKKYSNTKQQSNIRENDICFISTNNSLSLFASIHFLLWNNNRKWKTQLFLAFNYSLKHLKSNCFENYIFCLLLWIKDKCFFNFYKRKNLKYPFSYF